MAVLERDLSARYYVAEATVFLLGAVLCVARFLGLQPNEPLPIIGVATRNEADFARTVAILLAAALLYLGFEWTQSSHAARVSLGNRTRSLVATGWAGVSLWFSYPLLVRDTRYASVAPGWHVSFLLVGFLSGAAFSILIDASVMIRSRKESRAVGLPRVPVASRASFIIGIPAVVLLVSGYVALLHFAPSPAARLSWLLAGLPFLYVIGQGFASLLLHRDADGNRVPYAKRVAELKALHDFHDYGLMSSGEAPRTVRTMNIESVSSPDLQRTLREMFTAPEGDSEIRFRIEQLEETQAEFFSKGSDLRNSSPANVAVRIRKRGSNDDALKLLLIPEDAGLGQQEAVVSLGFIESHVEAFLAQQPSPPNVVFTAAYSHALNEAVRHTLAARSPSATLTHAAMSSPTKIVADLLTSGKDPNERGEFGWTPLLAASAQGHVDTMRVLLDSGADPDASNVLGRTPLMFGACYGNLDVCRLLLEHGANVDAQDMFGSTALMNAVADEQEEVVELLLEKAANVQLRDRENKTALELAQNLRHGSIAKRLRLRARPHD